ncbi:hypothetical protein VE04_07881 [Pseudogymnoascus sp. 24MN13]|nr:hypothetical protein VE04_07881 [Pseudogymnoascus sp. 24MN13]
MSSINGKNVLVTGASIGIGKQIALALAEKGANLILFSRTESKLTELSESIKSKYPGTKVYCASVDIQDYEGVKAGVKNAIKEMGNIDILINNAGLALGAPAAFQDLSISYILQMNNTNINGDDKAGAILNISSITGLEIPPFPGESVYHTGKAAQEAFSNALRNELSGTDIRSQYEKFFEGFTPLEGEDIAHGAVFMLAQPLNVSVKALDIVPTAQRSLTVFDREWNGRQEEN